jgi:hypothetical protein
MIGGGGGGGGGGVHRINGRGGGVHRRSRRCDKDAHVVIMVAGPLTTKGMFIAIAATIAGNDANNINGKAVRMIGRHG